ncbi:MAG: hypothetical protein VZR11_13890, partial [Succinimonas sp.]|nr:hypothetical protein [Succinimonas sp.]
MLQARGLCSLSLFLDKVSNKLFDKVSDKLFCLLLSFLISLLPLFSGAVFTFSRSSGVLIFASISSRKESCAESSGTIAALHLSRR